MAFFQEQAPAVDTQPSVSFPGPTIGVSLAAITAAYFLAGSAADVAIKAAGFLWILLSFVSLSGLVYVYDRRSAKRESRGRDIDVLLDVLDEAKDYFAGALDSSDTFRLIVSRIRSVLPVRSAVLWTTGADGTSLYCAESLERGRQFDDGLALKCHRSKAVVATRQSDTRGMTAALPLLTGPDVFGVLQLFFDDGFVPAEEETTFLDAVGARISPLILSSLAFDRSRDNALMDPTTELPNERAFYLVLENQLAEASRKLAERTVTILAIDVKGFDEINRRYGHSTGDAVLKHVAETIKDSLRQMDLFARSSHDEFLAILPTASTEVSSDVIGRVQAAFRGREFKVDDSDSIKIEVNFGWAEFGIDGDTAHEVVKTARGRKSHAKSRAMGNVLSFSQHL